MSSSAIVCQVTARHQCATVALLQQVLITQSVAWHTIACHYNYKLLGASRISRLCVVTLDKASASCLRPLPTIPVGNCSMRCSRLGLLFRSRSLFLTRLYRFHPWNRTSGSCLRTSCILAVVAKGMTLACKPRLDPKYS